MGIALEVARLVEEEARRAGAVRVGRAGLRVGRWSGVEVESLRFALEVVAEGTLLEGWAVDVEIVEPTFRCRECGETYVGEGYLDPCPRCAARGAELVAGDELTLARIEVEDR